MLISTKNTLIFAFAALIAASQNSFSQSFSEGTHYSIIEKPSSASKDKKTDSPSVVEYFSFSCPGCYAVEPSMKALIKRQPAANVKRIHMPFGGQKAKYSQKVFVAMTMLKADEHKDAIFSRIHVNRNLFNSDKEIVDFFTDLGYEKTEVEQTVNSFASDSMIRKMNKAAAAQKIVSVPTIIVNGKYQINVRALANANTLTLLVNHLHGLDG